MTAKAFKTPGLYTPDWLKQDAIAYAHRRARRECCAVFVYYRNGVAFVRAEYEPQPEGSQVIAGVSYVPGEA